MVNVGGQGRSEFEAAWRAGLAALVLGSVAPPALAQVVIDSTLVPGANLQGPNYAVTSDLGRSVGSNLFFSFAQFGLGSGESATFSGPVGVARIISRVTGGNASNIDGLIRSSIAGADFYFINPAGVVFGPNASVDVGGSFHVATAQVLKLGDEGRFDAADPGASSLTSAPPEAFGFLGGQGSLRVNGSQLGTAAGTTLSLVGGDLDIAQAQLGAPSGHIALVGIQGAGDVALDPSAGATAANGSVRIGEGTRISTDSAGATASGSIFVAAGDLAVSGATLASINRSADRGGAIRIDGGTVTLDAAARIETASEGSGAGGSISVTATDLSLGGRGSIQSSARAGGAGGDVDLRVGDTLTITGFDPAHKDLEDNVSSGLYARSFGEGRGGNLAVHAGSIRLADGGAIEVNTFQTGDAGDLLIEAADILMDSYGHVRTGNGQPSFGGSGGEVTVDASHSIRVVGSNTLDYPPDVFGVQNSGLFNFAAGPGEAGDVHIATPSLVLEQDGHIESKTFAPGDAGSIFIDTGELSLISGGAILENSGFEAGSGNAGTLSIHASHFILIDGNGDPTTVGFTSRLEGEAGATGHAADMFIETPRLTVDHSGSIAVSAFDVGRAGSIHIVADDVLLDHVGQISASTYGAGAAAPAGDLSIVAHNSLVVTGSTPIYSSAINVINFGIGSGGHLDIEAGRMQVDADSAVDNDNFGPNPDGGALSIHVGDLVMNGGGITASTYFADGIEGSGTGGGPTLSIVADRLIDIRATAGVFTETSGPGPSAGNGGTMSLRAPLLRVEGLLSAASSGGGVGGSIQVEADQVVMDGGVISASSADTGEAGTVRFDVTDSLRLHDGARIATQTTQSDGGNIDIAAGHLLELDHSQITTSAGGGTGNGGNIGIDPQFVVLNDSDITANAFGGNGGNILIRAGSFFASADSRVQASSALGIDGDISILSPVVRIGDSLGLPETRYLDASRFLHHDCAAGSNGISNHFVAAGRGGFPTSATGALFGPLTAMIGEGIASASADAADIPAAASSPFRSECLSVSRSSDPSEFVP